MGCDIHCYIDYDDASYENEAHTTHFGKIRVERNYSLFNIMAGVRSYGVTKAVCEPKGLPDNLSWQVTDAVSLLIIDADSTEERGCCTKADAKRWGNKYFRDNKNRVWHPDWHSHSWLTTEEVEEVIRRYGRLRDEVTMSVKAGEKVPKGFTVRHDWKEQGKIVCKKVRAKVPSEIKAVHAAMKALKKDGLVPRLVFWYDN